MVDVRLAVNPMFEKNPKIPLVLFEKRETVPFSTPTPSLDGFLVMCFSSRDGCRNRDGVKPSFAKNKNMELVTN